jgi:hypothetical protein
MSTLYRLQQGRWRRPSYIAQFDGPAELPRYRVNKQQPVLRPGVTFGNTYIVHAGDNFQSALDASNPLPNVVDRIILDAGATFVGVFTPRYKSNGGFTWIYTAGSDPEDTSRMTPTEADNRGLAKILGYGVDAAFAFGNKSNRWWFSDVEISAQPVGANYNYGFVRIGDSNTDFTVELMPHNIIFSRVYIHGEPGDVLWAQKGVIMNARYQAVINSWIDHIYWAGTETHGIGGWAGPGPFCIENTYIAAAGANVLFGGAYPWIAGLHPADFELRKNHHYKYDSWFGAGYAVKNLLEWKHGQRILVEGCIFENVWAEAQAGYAINIQPGGDSAPPPTAETHDVTFRYNIIRKAVIAMNLAGNPYQQAVPMSNLSVHDNLAYEIGRAGEAHGIRLLDDITNARVWHNHVLRDPLTGAAFFVDRDDTVPYAVNISFKDNLAGSNQPVGAVAGSGYIGNDALNRYSTSLEFVSNVLFDSNVAPPDLRAPDGNFWPATQAAVGMGPDYALLDTSPYKNAASDGTDPGADIAAVTSLTSGVVVAP